MLEGGDYMGMVFYRPEQQGAVRFVVVELSTAPGRSEDRVTDPLRSSGRRLQAFGRQHHAVIQFDYMMCF